MNINRYEGEVFSRITSDILGGNNNQTYNIDLEQMRRAQTPTTNHIGIADEEVASFLGLHRVINDRTTVETLPAEDSALPLQRVQELADAIRGHEVRPNMISHYEIDETELSSTNSPSEVLDQAYRDFEAGRPTIVPEGTRITIGSDDPPIRWDPSRNLRRKELDFLLNLMKSHWMDIEFYVFCGDCPRKYKFLVEEGERFGCPDCESYKFSLKRDPIKEEDYFTFDEVRKLSESGGVHSGSNNTTIGYTTAYTNNYRF
jgi:hypothetical protein